GGKPPISGTYALRTSRDWTKLEVSCVRKCFCGRIIEVAAGRAARRPGSYGGSMKLERKSVDHGWSRPDPISPSGGARRIDARQEAFSDGPPRLSSGF